MTQNTEISGIHISNFNEDIWQDIAESYVRSSFRMDENYVISKDDWYGITAESILGNEYREYRLGSIITMHSKLLICDFTTDLFHFDFLANADSSEEDYAKSEFGVTEDSIRQDFRTRVTTLLKAKKVAIPIRNCIDISYYG